MGIGSDSPAGSPVDTNKLCNELREKLARARSRFKEKREENEILAVQLDAARSKARVAAVTVKSLTRERDTYFAELSDLRRQLRQIRIALKEASLVAARGDPQAERQAKEMADRLDETSIGPIAEDTLLAMRTAREAIAIDQEKREVYRGMNAQLVKSESQEKQETNKLIEAHIAERESQDRQGSRPMRVAEPISSGLRASGHRDLRPALDMDLPTLLAIKERAKLPTAKAWAIALGISPSTWCHISKGKCGVSRAVELRAREIEAHLNEKSQPETPAEAIAQQHPEWTSKRKGKRKRRGLITPEEIEKDKAPELRIDHITLCKIRERSGLSTNDWIKAIGVSRSYWSKLSRGLRPISESVTKRALDIARTLPETGPNAKPSIKQQETERKRRRVVNSNRVKDLIDSIGLSTVELARKLNMNRSTIYRAMQPGDHSMQAGFIEKLEALAGESQAIKGNGESKPSKPSKANGESKPPKYSIGKHSKQAQALKAVMAASGLSVKDTAELLGCSPTHLSSMRSGAWLPSPELAAKMADLFQCEAETFLA